MSTVVVGVPAGRRRPPPAALFLFEFLRVSGEGRLISDLSVQRRHAVQQRVAYRLAHISAQPEARHTSQSAPSTTHQHFTAIEAKGMVDAGTPADGCGAHRLLVEVELAHYPHKQLMEEMLCNHTNININTVPKKKKRVAFEDTSLCANGDEVRCTGTGTFKIKKTKNKSMDTDEKAVVPSVAYVIVDAEVATETPGQLPKCLQSENGIFD